MSDANDGAGLLRRYSEIRAKISCIWSAQLRSKGIHWWLTFLVGVQHIVICISQGKAVGYGWYVVLAVHIPSLATT